MYLNYKTYFSFRYGTFSIKELVKAAVDNGVTALALNNINSTCDIWDFVKYCRDEGIKSITGAKVRNEGKLLYILIATNNNALLWINEFLSQYFQEDKPFPVVALEAPFFTDARDGFVIYPLGSKESGQLFVNEKIGVLPSEVNKLFSLDLKTTADKWIIRLPVTFQNKG
jgi:error-prone DNA polymerase